MCSVLLLYNPCKQHDKVTWLLNTEIHCKDRQRLEAVIRRGIRSGLCAPEHMSQEHLVTDTDDKLFNLFYTPETMFYTVYLLVDFNYNLRPRRHNLVLTAKSLSITDRDFITRMIYKDIY